MATRPVCKYGASCYRKNPDHFKQFSHPGREKAQQSVGGGGKDTAPSATVAGGSIDKGTAQSQSKAQRNAKQSEERGANITSFFGKRPERPTSPGLELKGRGGPPPAKKVRTEVEGRKLTTSGTSSSEVGRAVESTCPSEDTEREPSRESVVDGAELDRESSDVRENIRRKFLMEMPEDFYQFWEFCKSINLSKPETALEPSVGLELVGPYHVLAGRLKGVPWDKCVLHYRYFYDPPEFLTVLKGDTGSGFHIGYFRDDPGSTKCILASNFASTGCEIRPEAENIFAAVRWQVSSKLEDKSVNTDQQRHLRDLETKLESEMKKLRLPFTDPKTLAKQRNRNIVARCFHKIGIVVPYDKETELGYRPLPMTDRELHKLLDRIARCTDQVKRDKEFEPLQEIITFIQFANDECDYGMGMELGVDLFCYGDQFHNVVLHLLPLAYELLQRDQFGKIIGEHLKQRSNKPRDFCSC